MPNDRNVKQFLRWLPALLYIAVIITLSTQSIPGRLPGKYTDKLVHFCIYGVLCALAYAPLYRNGHANPLIGAILLSVAIGVLDETIQCFNPVRSASFADLIADAAGAVAGGLLCRKITGRPSCADRSENIMKNLSAVLLSFLAGILVSSAGSSHAEELDLVNRPVNASGLTGLIVTTAPFTVPDGTFEIGLSAMSETSTVPDYKVGEYPVTFTLGIARNMEIAAKASFLYREEGPDPARKRGRGDTELLYKWNFVPQGENLFYPALAAIATVSGLTGDSNDRMNRVHNWGASVGFSAGREVTWEDHVVGIYADARVALQDLNEVMYRDRYSLLNAGILLPISKQRNLQILVEYSAVSGKRFTGINVMNSSTITYGIRMVSERFNLTVGNQSIHKELEGYDASGRIIGTLSIKL